jgi:hypothetical protein
MVRGRIKIAAPGDAPTFAMLALSEMSSKDAKTKGVLCLMKF